MTKSKTMASKPFDLFDSVGHIRTDISEAELVSLDDARRDVVCDILSAHLAEQNADTKRRDREKALHSAVRERDRAVLARNKMRETSRIDAMRANIKARQREMGVVIDTIPEPAPLDQKAIDLADLKVQTAEVSVYDSRLALDSADRALKESRAALATALSKWINPTSAEDARRAALAAYAQRKPTPSPVKMSAIDQAAGRPESINIGGVTRSAYRKRAASMIGRAH